MQEALSSKDLEIQSLNKNLKEQEDEYKLIISKIKEEHCAKINIMRNDKNLKIGNLNKKYEEEAKKVKICLDKIKKLGEYVKSAKKILKFNFEDNSGKCQIKESLFSDDNLLKPIPESELDESQGLFNLSPESDKYSRRYVTESRHESRLKEAKELKLNLYSVESEIKKGEYESLHLEILNLVKETKLMFSVMDKVFPRKENDIICSLLEFSDNIKPNNIEEEIEELLRDNEEDTEFSVSKSIRELKKIKQNIVKLRQQCFDLF